MKLKQTPRGFGIGEFKDFNDVPCSIQKSSLATKNAIWLGTEPKTYCHFLDETKGPYEIRNMPENMMISTRMHLTQAMVKKLLPSLIKFADTGELS